MTDPRVERGTAAMLALRAERLAAGDRPLGWKLGFGAPAALERLGTAAPLVGFLTEASLAAPGATVSVAGWGSPVLEPEIALYVGDDLGIAELGPAVELADLDPSLADPEAILAGNIFHRRVVLGPGRSRFADGLRATVRRGSEQVAATDEPEALTGRLGVLVGHVAATLAAAGEALRPGDVVIAGSVVPAIPVRPGDRFAYALDPVGSVELAIA